MRSLSGKIHQVLRIIFKGTELRETDFSECDLTGAVFDDCDLGGATFEKTVLEKADFTNARNYSINPESNRIRKARFSMPEVVGLLHGYEIEVSPE